MSHSVPGGAIVVSNSWHTSKLLDAPVTLMAHEVARVIGQQPPTDFRVVTVCCERAYNGRDFNVRPACVVRQP